MKKLLYTLIGSYYSLKLAYADGSDGGIFGDFAGEESQEKLKTGDIELSDIPNMIREAIDFFMGIAGTIAIIFIIIGAYQILFGSFEQDKTKGKNTIIMAIFGFAIASLAWFIIKFIIDNLS